MSEPASERSEQFNAVVRERVTTSSDRQRATREQPKRKER